MFGVLLYLCLRPLMQNDQIWGDNIYGECVLLGGQPRRCVALFISELSFLSSLLYYYGRTLSDASMLYFADVFLYFFYARLSWPNG